MQFNPSQVSFRDRRSWLAAHLHNTDQKSVQFSIIIEKLKERFQFWQNLQDKNYPFTAVFIGVASGPIEIPLIQEFISTRKTNENLNFYCEDISPSTREEFYSLASGLNIKDSIKAYELNPFEDPKYCPPQADFILASHAWYYVSSWRQEQADHNSLMKFTRLIKPNGVGLIILQSQHSDKYALLSNHLRNTNTYQETNSEDIVEELTRLGIKHEVIMIESHSQLSSCFKNGNFNPSLEGKMLLSYWLRSWWDDIASKSQKHIMDDLKYLVNKNGCEELILRDAYIWIHNQ